jgi:hypothetical protein
MERCNKWVLGIDTGEGEAFNEQRFDIADYGKRYPPG